jgi:drug/metabolite transporter (DMT)-like permease
MTVLGVLASVLVFGLVHPVSKLFLAQGLPLSYFCVLYVGIRLLFQVPLVLRRRRVSGRGSRTYLTMVLLGLVGGVLQLLEFKGIDQGLPPATVTFLVFSYPVWILLMNGVMKAQTVGRSEIVQVGALVAGLFIFTRGEAGSLTVPAFNLVYPLLASLLMAAWIILSNRLRKDGVGILELSAFYDLFCVVALLGIFAGSWLKDWPQFLIWSQNNNYLIGIVAYSLIVGLLPNALFYLGTRQVSAHVSGAVMVLEPLFSTVYSAAIWGTTLSASFYLGGVLILLANLPKELWSALAGGNWLLKREEVR